MPISHNSKERPNLNRTSLRSNLTKDLIIIMHRLAYVIIVGTKHSSTITSNLTTYNHIMVSELVELSWIYRLSHNVHHLNLNVHMYTLKTYNYIAMDAWAGTWHWVWATKKFTWLAFTEIFQTKFPNDVFKKRNSISSPQIFDDFLVIIPYLNPKTANPFQENFFFATQN